MEGGGRFAIRAVEIDALGDLLDVRRVDRIKNARVRELGGGKRRATVKKKYIWLWETEENGG